MPGLRDYAANREDDSSEGNSSSDAETHRIFGDIQSVYDRLPPGGKWRAVIPGASHFTFSDDGALFEKQRHPRGVPPVRWSADGWPPPPRCHCLQPENLLRYVPESAGLANPVLLANLSLGWVAQLTLGTIWRWLHQDAIGPWFTAVGTFHVIPILSKSRPRLRSVCPTAVGQAFFMDVEYVLASRCLSLHGRYADLRQSF